MNAKKCVRALLCLYFSLFFSLVQLCAQALKVGDAVPDELWNMPLSVINHPSGKGTITLSEYKDKLIILDFWATWCGPCIKSLNKLQEIQKLQEHKLTIVPVSSSETKEKLTAFIQKKKWNYFSVINGKGLLEIFPHRYIPHYIWIYKGKVSAITGFEEVNQKNIEYLLERGHSSTLAQKEDLMDFDISRPIVFNGKIQIPTSLQYYTLLSGYIPGLITTISGINSRSTVLHDRIYAINSSIVEMYKIADERISKYPANRIMLEVEHPEALIRNDTSTKNLYSYDKKTRPMKVIELKAQMKEDLDRMFGLKTSIEARFSDCYELTSSQPIHTQGGDSQANIYDKENVPIKIINYPISVLVTYLNNHLRLYTIDRTNISGPVDLALPNLRYCSEKELLNALEKYGLHLNKIKKAVDFFVLKDDKIAKP